MNSSNKSELYNRIKQTIRITDYAQELGFTVVKRGKYYSIKEHDSVMINDEKNCFWRNSSGVSGSVIDFALEFTNNDLRIILDDFNKRLNGNPIAPSHPKKQITQNTEEFTLPKKDNNIKNIYAYLINKRSIDKSLVAQWIQQKRLYQDIHKNCVFVNYTNGNADFASLRGTNTYNKFIGDVPVSNYNHCFFISNNSDKLVVTESCIDLLSLLSVEKDMQAYNQLALSGTQKYPAIYNHLKENPNIKSIYLAFDNDKSGKKTINKIKSDLKDWDGQITGYLPPYEKDWNAYLQSIAQKKTAIEDYCSTINENQAPSRNIHEEIE